MGNVSHNEKFQNFGGSELGRAKGPKYPSLHFLQFTLLLVFALSSG